MLLPAVLAVVAAGVAARVLWLGAVPGLNADEAWYGVQLVAPHPTWRTPTGNPLNVFHMLPLALAHAVIPRTVEALRFPAALYGIATIALAPRLTRGTLGPTGRAALTLLVAGAPPLIAYARIGWDPCAMGFVSLLVLALALSRRWGLCVLALVAGVFTHPSNAILAVPLVALAATGMSRLSARARWIALATLVGAPALGAAIVLATRMAYIRELTSGAAIAGRALDLAGWATSVERYGDLMSGATVYEYVAAPPPPVVAWALGMAFWLLAIPVVAVGAWRHRRLGDLRPLALAVGLALALVALFIAFGIAPLSPGQERYALPLVAPTLLLIAWCVDAFDRSPRAARWAVGTAAAVSLASIVGAYLFLLRPHLRDGGETHRTFRSAAVEPKLAAARIILEDRAARPAAVLADDWWVAQPLTYFLSGRRELDVRPRMAWIARVDEPARTLREGGYAVGWIDGPLHRRVRQQLAPAQLRAWVLNDRGGRPLLGVWRLATP